MKELTFNLHFTDFCNFACKHCFIKKNGKELSLENIKLIVDKLAVYQKKQGNQIRINLAGGEPLISKNIQAIIDYIHSKNIKVSIITNGYYITHDFITNNKDKLSMIGISVDSLNHDTNIKIGRSCKGETLSKDKLIDICNFIKENGIKLKINTCVTTNNIDENIIELIKAIKPDRVKVLRAFCDSNNSNFNISDTQWKNTCMKYKDYNVIFEDNDFMKTGYIIIDSEGNLSRDNLHLKSNSLIKDSVENCLANISQRED